MKDQSTNFEFLRDEFPILYTLALGAEYNLYSDPNVSLFKLRQFVEKLVDTLYNEHYLDYPHPNTLAIRIKELGYQNIITDKVQGLLYAINSKGNVAAHQIKGTTSEATSSLLSAFTVSKWLYYVYVSEEESVSQKRFSKPEDRDARHALHLLEQSYAELEAKFQQLTEERSKEGLGQEKSIAIRKRAEKADRKIDMSEAQTRTLIDQQLRDAGWEVDTDTINFKSKKTLPERGKNKAIAEWPVGRKWADYALFVGTELYGIVEAKKYAEDISTNLHQSKIYAELAEEVHEAQLLGQWRNYKVPFLFSTNGRKYLRQLETKSGIWMLDVRKERNNSKSIKGWYSPDGLKALYEQDLDEAEQKLKERDIDFLTNPKGLSLRDYQIKAIRAVENILLQQPDRKTVLLAMATGTGKTRTINGLVYRLISTNRFKRILFLVDRTMLAGQAFDAFEDNKVDGTLTFSDSYKVTAMKEAIPELDTRLHFATVQSMVKRLFYGDVNEPTLPVDTYDCIIVDEAHRGYLLDRAMDEEEITFKNQDNYVSMYRMVIDYFDAFVVGLTATPALHTSEIFGKAIYSYTYREAVVDGWLIDHDSPTQINTKLSEEGILWEKGDKPKVYDKEEGAIVELDELEDELHIELTGFNKQVITEPFNRTVVQYLVNELDPDGEEKTLIFAARNSHADLVVKLLKEEFAAIGAPVQDEAIEKITGKAHDPTQLLKKFKNEKYPNIVVTVDLLTTGIDVPRICNIVFLRRVRSRILYEQMLGRATRRCDDIGKEVFKIYDAVRIYEALQDFTNMKPVTVSPTTTFVQLAEEMAAIDSEERTARQVEQIIAKLQRKKQHIVGEEVERFAHRSDGQEVEAFIDMLRQLVGKQGQDVIPRYAELWQYLDHLRPMKRYELISEHEDELRDATESYGVYKRPEDYISGFQQWIDENKNKIAALNIVCTKPSLLDRKSLKELKLELDAHGYKTRMLNRAWRESKNEDIAADIISYIRTLTLGSELVDHETRIKQAMASIRDLQKWNKIQTKWLDRFEKQLLAESVIQRADLDKPPFSNEGGYERLNRIFDEKLDDILAGINENLYKDIA